MLKSGSAIRELLFADKPVEERLVISPILDWDSQLQDGNASIDLRLGSTFRVTRRSQVLALDPFDKERYEIDRAKYVEEIYVEIGDRFILHPHQFALGITLEWVRLPKDLGAFIIGRSTWGRDGLIIETAAGVHPGYSGNLTLELTNVGDVPVILYPGLAYAQVFLFDVEQKSDVTGGVSAFLGTTTPKSGMVSKDKVSVTIGALIEAKRVKSTSS
jgi:dCTP deaminase